MMSNRTFSNCYDFQTIFHIQLKSLQFGRSHKQLYHWAQSDDTQFNNDSFVRVSVTQNKGCGMCYPVCGKVHIKDPLLLIDKSSLCGGSRFPL